jgi:glycosyltransferase involved in cell wall biosynthesis
MKITHVLGTVDPAFGGPVSVVYGLAEAQMRLGHQVMVVSLDSPFGREGRPTPSDSSVQTALYPVALPSLGLSRGLLRHLSSAESDCVIHFHSPYHFGTALGITRALRAGAPTLFHPHGAFNIYPRSKKRFKKAPYERLIERRRLEQADAVICASLREAAEVRLFCGGAKTAVVPLGVSTPHVTLRPQDIVRRQPSEGSRPPRAGHGGGLRAA